MIRIVHSLIHFLPTRWLLLASTAFAVLWGHACKGPGETEVRIPDQVSYNLHIRPILSDNCFACHGPDANKREAGLRLDIEEDALKALKDNPNSHAIVPGRPKDSEVFDGSFPRIPSRKCLPQSPISRLPTAR